MYRIVTLAVLRAGVDPDDSATPWSKCWRAWTSLVPTDPDQQRHRLDGDDVTVEIRSPQVTSAVSPVSAIPAVRLCCWTGSEHSASSGRMVVEGRDIGTVIVPDAELKIYLTATPRNGPADGCSQNVARRRSSGDRGPRAIRVRAAGGRAGSAPSRHHRLDP